MKLQIDNLGKVSVTVEQGYWSPNKDYDKLTIVQVENEFATYISRKVVPINVVITDREYWIPFSSLKEDIVLDYNEFISRYGEELVTIKDNIDSIEQHLIELDKLKGLTETAINKSNIAIKEANATLSRADVVVKKAEDIINDNEANKTRLDELEKYAVEENEKLNIKINRGLETLDTRLSLEDSLIKSTINSLEEQVYLEDKKLENKIKSEVEDINSKINTENTNIKSIIQDLETKVNTEDTNIKTQLNTLIERFNTLVDSNSTEAIDTFNEIIEFLKDIDDTNSLKSIIAGIQKNISDGDDKLKAEIDYINEGDKPLISPTLSGTWTIYKNDGTTFFETKNSSNITIENGFKAKLNGTFKWVHNANNKDPEVEANNGTSGDWGDVLPENNTPITKEFTIVSASKSYTQKLYASKKGLETVNGKIKKATGNDTTNASIGVTFTHKIYWGLVTTKTIDASIIKSLANSELSGSRGKEITKVTTSDNQYFIYAYPDSLGDLTGITQDGAAPILGDFDKGTVNIINDAEAPKISYRYYVSTNKGAFTNATVKFI